jgi:hypothetical protein
MGPRAFALDVGDDKQPAACEFDAGLQASLKPRTPLEVQPQRLRDALCDGRYWVEIGIWFLSPHKLTY